jgi:hypothetical protein
MAKFRAHVIISASSKDQAAADLAAMTAAYAPNKSVQLQWMETMEGG